MPRLVIKTMFLGVQFLLDVNCSNIPNRLIDINANLMMGEEGNSNSNI